MACPQCGSGNYALLPLIWEQGTQIGAFGGAQSLEAARNAPPGKISLAGRITFVVAAGLVGGPIVSTAFGKVAALVTMAIVTLLFGLPVLRDLRWNFFEQPFAIARWAATFACRSCGLRWLSREVPARTAPAPGMKIAAIAALCCLVIGPGLLTRRATSQPATVASSTFETRYVHGSMNVRSGPGTAFPVVTTLRPGVAVHLGPEDANGWAALQLGDGTRVGFVYRRSDLIRAYRP